MLDFFDKLELTEKEEQISHLIIREIRSAWNFCATSVWNI